eukprot:jgi/Phyca11/113731/e_gw1.24.440.1
MVEVEKQKKNGTCTGCSISHQMKISCRHVQKIIYNLVKENSSTSPQYDMKQLFHCAYQIAELPAALELVGICLPVYDQLENKDQIRAPPLYRQAGRKLQRSKELETFTRQ